MNSLLVRMIASRLAISVVTLLIVSLLVFIATGLLPGDVTEAILGQSATPEAVKALRESPAFNGLDRARQTLVEDSLRGFELSGVALEEPARSRFKAIQNELSKLETEFEEAVLDATDAWTRPVTEAELAGDVTRAGPSKDSL